MGNLAHAVAHAELAAHVSPSWDRRGLVLTRLFAGLGTVPHPTVLERVPCATWNSTTGNKGPNF